MHFGPYNNNIMYGYLYNIISDITANLISSKGRFIPPVIPPSGFSVVMDVRQYILIRAVTVASQFTGINNRKHGICRGDDFALCDSEISKKKAQKV